MPRNRLYRASAICFVMLLAAIAVRILYSSHALSPYQAIDAANGTLTDPAKVYNDPSATDGSYVRFGNLPTTKTPNQVFDLSEWDLTLPVDSAGDSGGTTCPGEEAAEVIPASQLLTGFTDPYFQLNSSNDLVFTAPSNGATTTPCEGSNHVRTELHEDYKGPGAVDDCWTSSLGGTLTASAVINKVSVNSDEATIGQIHGNGSAVFVLLIYRPASKEILLNVYDSPSSGSTHAETEILGNVELGQTINYTLSFKNGIITATVNGTTVTLTAGSGWATYPVKLDLGAYSAAPNTGNPAGDETQVTFSSFDISH